MRIASRPLVCLVSRAVLRCRCVLRLAPRARSPADAVGIRAQGMGGAFTAVADDATASWWNPAGMAGGAYFNALIEAGNYRQPNSERTDGRRPAERAARRYAQFCRRLSGPRPELLPPPHQRNTAGNLYRDGHRRPTRGWSDGGPSALAGAQPVRRQRRAVARIASGDRIDAQAGERGRRVAGAGSAAAGSLDAATDLDPSERRTPASTSGRWRCSAAARIGVMVRNVKELEFGSGIDAFRLSRQARVGAALSSGTRGVIGTATLAVDADLTTTTTVLGDERRVAAGGEVWTTARTFGVARRRQREHDRHAAHGAERRRERGAEEGHLRRRRADRRDGRGASWLGRSA